MCFVCFSLRTSWLKEWFSICRIHFQSLKFLSLRLSSSSSLVNISEILPSLIHIFTSTTYIHAGRQLGLLLSWKLGPLKWLLGRLKKLLFTIKFSIEVTKPHKEILNIFFWSVCVWFFCMFQWSKYFLHLFDFLVANDYTVFICFVPLFLCNLDQILWVLLKPLYDGFNSYFLKPFKSFMMKIKKRQTWRNFVRIHMILLYRCLPVEYQTTSA